MSRPVRLSLAITLGLLLGAGLGYIYSLNNPGSAAAAIPVFALATAPALAVGAWLILNRQQFRREARKNEQDVESAWSDRAAVWAFALLICALTAGSLANNLLEVPTITPVIYIAFGLGVHAISYLVIKHRES